MNYFMEFVKQLWYCKEEDLTMQHIRKLADINATPSGPNARVLSSEVVSLHGENRKKRSEIALAVDGYGIEIRDVRCARSCCI